MNEGAISLKHVWRSYGKQDVLKDVSLSFPSRGLYVILGASGSGKTTLLNVIAGLDEGFRGHCRVLGVDLGKDGEEARQRLRLGHMGYLFQNFNLLELENALSNVLLPMEGVSLMKGSLAKRRAMDLLRFVGLKGKAKAKVSSLSGGEKQRVALARALANDPEILLADEPTGALDEKNGDAVFSLLRKASKNRLVIVVSHDERLSLRYADQVIRIHDGVVDPPEELPPFPKEEAPPSIKIGYRKGRPSLGKASLFAHAFRLLKAKSRRSLISLSAISIGLVGLGLSLYVSSSIREEIGGALDSILSRRDFVMEPLQDEGAVLKNVASASEKDAQKIASLYPEKIKDYGISYMTSFDEVFSDAQEFYFVRGKSEIPLERFSARTFSETLWLDDFPQAEVYPGRPSSMEEDEIVLGLPYRDMAGLCFGLEILRNYESLGEHIQKKGLTLYLHFAHYAWGYEDFQMLRVVGAIPTKSPSVFHLNHRWNAHFFEEALRFPSKGDKEGGEAKPWTFRKAYFIESVGSIGEFCSFARDQDALAPYLFERASYLYSPTHCPIGEVCSLNRAYLYLADKSGVPHSLLGEILRFDDRIESCLPGTPGSYFAQGGSLAVGCPFHFFASPRPERLDLAVDAYSSVKKEDASSDFSLPSGVEDAYYLKSALGGIRFERAPSTPNKGRAPSSLDEVALSENLMEEWGSPSEIHVAAVILEEEAGGRVERTFARASLRVVGSHPSPRKCLFVGEDWTIDFFRDRLGMSSFLLESSSALFRLYEEKDMAAVLSNLRKRYPRYTFQSQSAEMMESLNETTSYIGTLLFVFSGIALSISTLLYAVVLLVSVGENKGEMRLLFVLGASRSDVADSLFAQATLYVVGSFLLSALSLVAMEWLCHHYVVDSFGGASSFHFAYWPLAMMAAFSAFLLLLSYLLIRLYAERAPLSKA